MIDPLEVTAARIGPNGRTEGNVFVGAEHEDAQVDRRRHGDGRRRQVPERRRSRPRPLSFGDIEKGFKEADLIIERDMQQQTTSHQPLESRSAMAYWQNGKCYLHGSTQSVARTVASVAGWVGIKPEELVLISEYTGGGFGSKIPGAQSMAIPALMSKKLNGRPVMMRISREEETYIGRVRPGYQGWIKMGFKKDGRVTAIDTFIVEASGPYRRQGDHSTTREPRVRCCSRRRTCASAASRWRPTRRRASRSARRAACRRRCWFEPMVHRSRAASSASIRSRFAR